KTSAYALITHCRSSCEKPRSTLIDGSATFTTAMSRTTMNWTTERSASASHLRRSDATMSPLPFASVVVAGNLAGITCSMQVKPSQQHGKALQCLRAQGLRPVLPGRPRARPRRRAVGAPRRAGADARAEALHRPGRPPPRDRHERPRLAAPRPRGGRARDEAHAAAAGRLARLRADRLRARPEGRDPGARALGRALARAAERRGRALPGLARERGRHRARAGRAGGPVRVPGRRRGRVAR